jgi:haloalkane dehalogenase
VQGCNAFLLAAFHFALEQRDRLTPAVKAGYLAPYGSWSERVAIQRFVEDIPLRNSHPSYNTLVEIEAGLARMQELPKLLIWGLKDWCFSPAFLERFLEFWPTAEVLKIPAAGHWVVEDARDAVARRVFEFVG